MFKKFTFVLLFPALANFQATAQTLTYSCRTVQEAYNAVKKAYVIIESGRFQRPVSAEDAPWPDDLAKAMVILRNIGKATCIPPQEIFRE